MLQTPPEAPLEHDEVEVEMSVHSAEEEPPVTTTSPPGPSPAERVVDDLDAGGQVLHVRVDGVPHKCLRTEARALKDFEGYVMQNIPLLADLKALTHKDIIHALLARVYDTAVRSPAAKASYPKLDALVRQIVPEKRDDGTEVWHEMIEGRGFSVVMAEIPGLETTHLALARLHSPLDLHTTGTSNHVRFVGVCFGPPRHEVRLMTRTVFESARSLASILSSPKFRVSAEHATTEAQLHRSMKDFMSSAQTEHAEYRKDPRHPDDIQERQPYCICPFSGLCDDISRRKKWYVSDFTDAWGYKSKVLSTAIYLFCVILAPAIAFGELMTTKTHGRIGAMEILLSQSASGLIFSLFGGCPFVIIMTTGPLTVFIGFLYEMAESMDVDFMQFYAWVGIWNAIWLVLSVMFNLSNHIHYVTAFVDQIFGCLVAGIFAYEAIKPTAENFFSPDDGHEAAGCMGVVLMIGTFLASIYMIDIRASLFFKSGVRNVISDYGTAIAIILMTGIYHLAKVDHVATLNVPNEIDWTDPNRTMWVDVGALPTHAKFVAAGPALLLFTLFFLDENITSILSNKPEFKLWKGEAMHLDIFVVAIINLFLALLGLPYLHGALPQSPLHVMQLADFEEFVDQGVVQKRVVKSRETRMTGFLCHVFMTICTIFALPVLKAVPVPVLQGVFLTMAFQGARDNPFVERLLLWFTELSKYPPTHMVRRLKLSVIYKYTVIQLLCWGALWGVKSSPIALGFPFVIVVLVIFRHVVLSRLFSPHELYILED